MMHTCVIPLNIVKASCIFDCTTLYKSNLDNQMETFQRLHESILKNNKER